jgi:phosphatidylserine/phosphatidylglycerophosphate/cardiolipin synthase-like enzyme
LKLIIDDDGAHGKPGSAETQATARLLASAGAANVKRQHMGGLQHNKTIVVDGPAVKKVVCGSTNLSWRGFFVQSNNAIVLSGRRPVAIFAAAFDAYFANNKPAAFAATAAAAWTPLGLRDITAQVAFSPHGSGNAVLAGIGQDIASTRSSLFYSLAFLSITPGVVKDAITQVTRDPTRFVYGMADQPVGGIVLVTPDGNAAPVSPAALSGTVPQPFRREPVGGAGVRMHHKFVVIDFDKPTARVYTGSYNFSRAADLDNGENLLLIRNRRVAVAYMIEALGIFDHYRFRIKQAEATRARTTLTLQRPPRAPGEEPWWAGHYRDGTKMRDRKLFSA